MEGVPAEVEGALHPNLVELKETLAGHNNANGAVLVPGSNLIDLAGDGVRALAKTLKSLSPGAKGQELKGAHHVEPVIRIN